MSPTVSLLIPIYNVEKYLEPCLQSALGQTLTDIEIICINDGSTDGSAQILERYAERDRRLRVITKANSGYGASLNRGLAEATGEYVAILESDDWMELDTLKSLLAQAQRNNAQLARGNYWNYWSEPKERNVLERAIPKKLGKFAGQAISPMLHLEVFGITPSIWGTLYRRDLLENNSILLETPGASYQDASFAFKVWATAERVVLLNAAFVHYRQDNETSSVRSSNKVFCVMDEYTEIKRFLHEDRPDRLETLLPVFTRQKLLTYLWNLDRLDPVHQLKFIEAARSDIKNDQEKGLFCASALEPWYAAELRILLEDPQWLITLRASRKISLVNQARYYYEIGGVPMMFKAAGEALGRL